MITSCEQAVGVQGARRDAGLKGRSKAVRRWFKSGYGCAVEATQEASGAHGGRKVQIWVMMRLI